MLFGKAVEKTGLSAVWSISTPRARVLWLVAVLGLVARFVLALRSEGSNDVRIWTSFAHFIRQEGLFAAYRELTGVNTFDPATGSPIPVFNSPPLPGLYMAGAQAVSEALHVRFSLFIKLPGLCGELLSAWVLARMFRGSPERAAATVAAFAWSLCSILVSGFHGNTDCAYAGLMLLGCYLLEDRKRPFLAGLALAGATNVKLIPLFIILPLLITTRDRRILGRLVAGLAVGAVAFLPSLVAVFAEFFRNVVSYTPDPEFWGIEGIAMTTFTNQRWADGARTFFDWYLHGYRPILFGALLAVALLERLRPRLDNYQRCTLFLTIFLLLTPGFGVQYTAALAPLAFSVSISWGMRYAVTSGLTILVVYLSYLTRGPLLNSHFTGRFPFPAPMIGMVAWYVLLEFAVFLLQCRRSPPPVLLKTASP